MAISSIIQLCKNLHLCSTLTKNILSSNQSRIVHLNVISVRNYIKKSPVICIFCNKTFPSQKALNFHFNKEHYNGVNNYLIANPVQTYISIFGNNYKYINENEMRYSGGLIVTLKGENKGKWYNFTQGVGGGPIQAIMNQLGIDFAKAIQHLPKIMNLKPIDLEKIAEENQNINTEMNNLQPEISEDKLKKIELSKEIWKTTVDLKGTLGEIYLVKYRHISPKTIDSLAFRFLKKNKTYLDNIGNKPIYACCLVVPVFNPEGEVTGIQRIFLDEETGDKIKGYIIAKKSMGMIKGGAGLVQKGIDNGTVYVVEGPETGASIASVMGPEVTVIASMSLSRFTDVTSSILVHKPKKVILAIDRDRSIDAKKTCKKGYLQLKADMDLNKIEFHLVAPSIESWKDSKEKSIDFNDILVRLGPEILKQQLLDYKDVNVSNNK